MPKVPFKCDLCDSDFLVWPAAVRHAEQRGYQIRFCSKACRLQARREGKIAGKKVRGETLTCEVCQSSFYRTQYMVKAGKARFCSETCRQEAYKQDLIDRTGPRPNRLLGKEISCKFCGKEVYRKKSMIDRNIAQTCGSRKCISSYGRALWGLPPLPDDPVPRGRGRRRTELFTAVQRREWLGDYCAWCGSAKNLTLDHIIAVCCGGKSVKENAQTLCGRCNNIKARTVDLPLAREQALSGG